MILPPIPLKKFVFHDFWRNQVICPILDLASYFFKVSFNLSSLLTFGLYTSVLLRDFNLLVL